MAEKGSLGGIPGPHLFLPGLLFFPLPQSTPHSLCGMLSYSTVILKGASEMLFKSWWGCRLSVAVCCAEGRWQPPATQRSIAHLAIYTKDS